MIAVALSLLSGCSCQPSLPSNPPNNPPPNSTDSTPPPVDTGPPPICLVPEIEPNNSVDEATPLPLELLACGEIAEVGDIDVFEAEVTEESWISISTMAKSIGSFMDVQLVVTPPVGSATVRTNDDATTDANLVFPGDVGLWAVALSEQNFSGGEQYFYRMMVGTAKAPVTWTATEVEPNDALITAMPVVSGETIYGDMGGNLDGDWYRIDIPPGKHTLLAEVVAYSEGSPGNFMLYLSDAGQNLLPSGCDPGGDCATRGNPIDPGIRDPLLEWDSEGNEQLFVKVAEEDFHWGRHTWYVITFSLVSA